MTAHRTAAAPDSSTMLTRVTWVVAACGIGTVGLVGFLIVHDSFGGSDAAVAESPAGRENRASLLPAASLVEVAAARAAPVVVEEPVTEDVPLLLVEPEVVDEPPAPLQPSEEAITAVPEAEVVESVAEESLAASTSPIVENPAEVPPKKRKLQLPPQKKPAQYNKQLDGKNGVSGAYTYDTPTGVFQIRMYGIGFAVITPHGTQFTSEDFTSHTGDRLWGGLVVIDDAVYLATDMAIYYYRVEPEETFVLVGSTPGIQTKIDGSLDQYFLLYAPTGGWSRHGKFLGFLDLRAGEDGLPKWQLLPYEGRGDLKWVEKVEVDNKRQRLMLCFCKPEDPGVVRGKNARQKYLTVTFDVATETFLSDTETEVPKTP